MLVAHVLHTNPRDRCRGATLLLSPPFRPPHPQVAAGGRDKPQASCYDRVSRGRESRRAANRRLQGFLSASPTRPHTILAVTAHGGSGGA